LPAGRPYWKGYIKLALVSCPIAVYTASSSSERVAFRQINKVTGNRLRQQLVDEETREPVDTADKGRGYEVDKNRYLLVQDEELEAIEIESNHTIEIDAFVPHSEIDQRYFDSPYYIAPNEKVGVEAFAVIRDAMRGKSMAALGRIVLSKRERVIALQPGAAGQGLFRRHSRREDRCGNAFPSRAYSQDEGAAFRPVELPRPLRGSRRRDAQKEARGHAGLGSETVHSPHQRRQSDGCAASEHR
jgi:DNA end-binding protein Ku